MFKLSGTYKNKTEKKEKSNEIPTYIAVVQDKSGSMQWKVDEVITGFNEYLDELLLTLDHASTFLSVYQFDTKVWPLYVNRRIDQATRLDHGNYYTGGMTALYDSIGHAIDDLSEKPTESKKILVIMTDGFENISKEYNAVTIKNKISKFDTSDNNLIIYLGADLDTANAGLDLGVNTSVNYSNNTRGAYRGSSIATQNFLSGDISKDEVLGVIEDSLQTTTSS